MIFFVMVYGFSWSTEFRENPKERIELSLQLLGIAAGLVGTAWGARVSARDSGREYIKAHARPAFRQLVILYQSISEVARIIESAENAMDIHEYDIILSELRGIVFGQLNTADSALEQWHDIVPEDVEELYKRISADNRTEDLK